LPDDGAWFFGCARKGRWFVPDRFAKSQVGWSAYIDGLQVDYDQIHRGMSQACEHVRKKMGKTA
jgi:hypothetical protein